jgi:hypothetical protein
MFDNLVSESKLKYFFLSSFFLVTASSAFLYAKNKLKFLNNNDNKNNNNDPYYTNRSNYVKNLKKINFIKEDENNYLVNIENDDYLIKEQIDLLSMNYNYSGIRFIIICQLIFNFIMNI